MCDTLNNTNIDLHLNFLITLNVLRQKVQTFSLFKPNFFKNLYAVLNETVLVYMLFSDIKICSSNEN